MSFSTLQTALTSLLSQRRAMDLIGHNVANANTDGYTRRRVELDPLGGTAANGFWSRTTQVGNGVDVTGVTRMREEFLDLRVRAQMDRAGSATRLADIYSHVEGLIPEPSDSGVAAQLSAFWSAWSAAAARPGDLPTRSAVLSRAETLAHSLSSTAQALTDYRNQLENDTRVTVAQVNADTARIAQLNGAIVTAVANGVDAGDLQDQRDQLIDRVVSNTGATFRTRDDGAVDVFLGGGTLVRGMSSEPLEVVKGGPLDPPNDSLPMQRIEVRWAMDGYPIQSLGGALAADVTALATVVPGALRELDAVAADVVASVNALHLTGHGLDPVADVDLNFFDPAGVTASTIALSADVAGNPSRIALAALTAGDLDGSLGHAISSLAESTSGADAKFRNLIGRLGVEAQSATSSATIATRISNQVQQERKDTTGVNLDEEMAALVATQRAYEAAARLLTAADEMLDQLINRTGVVGR